jgi:hypothetical protein
VAYLRNSENGVITENTVTGYVAGICKLLSDPDCLARLKAGCRKSASIYTIQAMVENFGGGICACLAAPHRRAQCKNLASIVPPNERTT